MSKPEIRIPSEETRFVTSDGKAFESFEEAGAYQAVLDLADWLQGEYGSFIERDPYELAKDLIDNWSVRPKEES